MKKTACILFALCLFPLACASTVSGTGTTGSKPLEPVTCGGGGGYGGGGYPSAPAMAAPSAIAILASQINWNAGAGGGGSSSSSGSGGSSVDPNTLYLMVGSPVPACAAPFASSGDCGPAFSVSIGIPPQLQQPGTVPLSSPELISTFSEMGPANSTTPGDCPGGAGSFLDGTIEIVSIDATQVTFTLNGTMMFAGDGVPDEVADGTYTAPRCP